MKNEKCEREFIRKHDSISFPWIWNKKSVKEKPKGSLQQKYNMREAIFGVPNSNSHELENKDGCKSFREGSGFMWFEALLERLKTKQQDPKTQ